MFLSCDSQYVFLRLPLTSVLAAQQFCLSLLRLFVSSSIWDAIKKPAMVMCFAFGCNAKGIHFPQGWDAGVVDYWNKVSQMIYYKKCWNEMERMWITKTQESKPFTVKCVWNGIAKWKGNGVEISAPLISQRSNTIFSRRSLWDLLNLIELVLKFMVYS